MADDFSKAMRTREPWSNAEDPTADRMGAYPEAGELNSASTAHAEVGQESGPDTAPIASDPSGPDADLLQAGGPGDRLGGYHATDSPVDPGLPGHDQPAEGGREEAEDGGTGGPFVDRLGR